MRRCFGSAMLVACAFLLGAVFAFHPATNAAAPDDSADSADQDKMVVDQLKEVNAQLKDLAVLLRSGRVRVTVLVNPDLDRDAGRK